MDFRCLFGSHCLRGRFGFSAVRKRSERGVVQAPAPFWRPSLAVPAPFNLHHRHVPAPIIACSPVVHYGIMLAEHILPTLGRLEVAEVERKHILAFQYELRARYSVCSETPALGAAPRPHVYGSPTMLDARRRGRKP